MRTKPWQHLIRVRDLGWRWPALYAVTFGLAFLCGWLRSLAVALVLLILQLFTIWFWDLRLPVKMLALIVGFGPLVVSLATLVLPLGSWIWQQALGGRRPSEREQAVLDAALAQLREADPGLRAPGRWIVVDSEETNAAAYANAIAVTRALLDSSTPQATIAHELGHLELLRREGQRRGQPADHPAARSGRADLPDPRLVAQWSRSAQRDERPVGHVLAPSRGICRCLRRPPRPGAGAGRLPRGWRRRADALEGLRYVHASLDRAPHRRARSRGQLTPGHVPVKVAPAGRPCGPALSRLPVTGTCPCVESGNYVGQADNPNNLERSPRCVH